MLILESGFDDTHYKSCTYETTPDSSETPNSGWTSETPTSTASPGGDISVTSKEGWTSQVLSSTPTIGKETIRNYEMFYVYSLIKRAGL